ncbi:MAG TPA: radical SAM protein, partial [Deltaproteobacteria bacterium]|nr:radical SAM protein [Deltaproteobacteria bacterium]
MSCLLINPPLVKPSEPPPGIARLAGALEASGVSCALLDANIEGILHLLRAPCRDDVNDTWTRRARRHLPKALEEIRTPTICNKFDRYRRAVMDIHRVLQLAARPSGVRLSLADYHDEHLSPVRSADCLRSFANPETNPFYSYFEERIPSLLDETRPAVVGLSLNFLSQALTAFALAGYIRRIDPGLKIIVGGGLATSWKRNPAWSDPFRDVIDLWVDGPGEKSLLDCFGKAGDDRLFPPRYEGLPLDRYLSPGLVLPYDASRGCWWLNCSFCPERAERNRYRPVPPETVTNDLRKLVDDHDPALIHLVDNALSPALLRELVKTPPGAPWYG